MGFRIILKPVIGYEGIYLVSEFGDVIKVYFNGKTIKTIIMKSGKNRKGYLVVSLSKDNVRKSYSIAYLVARNFIGKRPDGLQINHKDGNKINNHFSNLEYVTCKENVIHAWKKGLNTAPCGSKQGLSKLTEEQVLEIRSRYATGTISQSKLAKIYGVNQANIGFIINRKYWKHI